MTVRAELVPSKTVFAPGERIEYKLRNVGEEPIGCGPPYSLERRADGGWAGVPVGVAFRLPLYFVDPDASRAFSGPLPADLTPGRYRLLTDVSCNVRSPGPTTRSTLDFEFEVVL